LSDERESCTATSALDSRLSALDTLPMRPRFSLGRLLLFTALVAAGC
jgi:hypothetical protein